MTKTTLRNNKIFGLGPKGYALYEGVAIVEKNNQLVLTTVETEEAKISINPASSAVYLPLWEEVAELLNTIATTAEEDLYSFKEVKLFEEYKSKQMEKINNIYKEIIS